MDIGLKPQLLMNLACVTAEVLRSTGLSENLCSVANEFQDFIPDSLDMTLTLVDRIEKDQLLVKIYSASESDPLIAKFTKDDDPLFYVGSICIPSVEHLKKSTRSTDCSQRTIESHHL